MNHHNFITRRFHSNEATLFINPRKTKKNKEIGKPRIIFSFVLVLIVFFSIIGFSVLAKQNDSTWKLWHDEEYEFTYIDSFGSINKSDLMTLTINNRDCDTLSVNFFINSHDRERAEDGERFTLEITETPHEGVNWQDYTSEIYINYSEIINDYIVYVLSFDHVFETQYWIERLEQFEPFYFSLSIHENPDEQINPSRFFEHTYNQWDMEELQQVLKEAYRNCRFKTYNQTIL